MSLRVAIGAFAVLLGSCFFAVWFVFRPVSFGDSPPIPQGWGYYFVDGFKGAPATPAPLTGTQIPQHPFLAATPSAHMHGDGYNSGTHPAAGPLGLNPRVDSYAHANFGGECATITFDSAGRPVAVCATFARFSVVVFDPSDLRPLASFDLPPRASSKSLDLRRIMSDTSGGAYFFLDNRDRVVLVDAEQRLKVIAQKQRGNDLSLFLEQEFDLSGILEQKGRASDVVTSVLPDWSGRYWFVSRGGIVGTLEPQTGSVAALRLEGEEIQNSLAADAHAVYLVSDHALYAMTTGPDGLPVIEWRQAYQRASRQKPGNIDLGSGTTPTLIGEEWVAITDNAEPRVNVLVFQRAPDFRGPRLVCKVPVFDADKGAVETSLIGYGRSIIVGNNYGYDLFPTMMFGRTGAGGLARIDILLDGTDCQVKWRNPAIAQTALPKLSLPNGLVYLYTKDAGTGFSIDAYYFTAVEFATGKTRFEVLAGTGVSYDNNWGTTALGADGCAYVGCLRGLLRNCDGG